MTLLSRLFTSLLTALVLASGLCLVTSYEAHAQSEELSIPLQSLQTQFVPLDPATPSGQTTFVVDDATALTVDINATTSGFATEITGPGGESITPSTVASFGGTYEVIAASPASGGGSPVLLPQITGATHFVYQFPSLGAGPYTVAVSSASLTQDEAALVELRTDSPVASGLVATEPVVPLGTPVVFVSPMFEDADAILGAQVDVVILNDDGSEAGTLTLTDDGTDADAAAGDGLYTGLYPTPAVGTFSALATSTGSTSGGAPFTRQAGTQFSVVAPAGSILNGSIQDQGVDDNGNGLFDRVQIDVGVDAVNTGTYVAYVQLETAGGQTLTRNGLADLTPGPGTVSVDVEATDLQELGEDGPYSLRQVDLLFVSSQGTVPSDRLSDAGQTQAYALTQLERPAILLTGGSTDTPRDTDGNGLFDLLDVSVDVNLLTGGFYQWSGRLVDDLGNEIEFVGSSGFLGTGNGQITFTFDGTAIGANGVDGPYVLTDLLMFSSSTGANLVASSVAVTAAYDVEQFEGTPERCPATLRLTGFDADQGESDIEEFVTVTNTGTDRVLVTDCALVFYDGVGEATYFALDLQGAVDPGASHVVGNPGLSNVAQTFPINTLEDGPDAIALYQRPASDFPTGTGLVTDETLISAIVYVSDDEIFGAKRGGVGGSPSDILASLRDLVEGTGGLPAVLTLEGNAPNPFRTTTQIRFALPKAAAVSLDVYDVLGRRVLRVVDADLPAGWHTARVDGSRLASGAYFYRLQAGDEIRTRSLRLVR